jgi:cytochrome c2
MVRSGLVLLSLLLGGDREARADDDDDSLRKPGIRASYQVPGRAQPVLRSESMLGYALKPGESPDPRLPSQGWRVSWDGVIEILQPGKYRFTARGSGPVSLEVDGKAVLEASGGQQQTSASAMDLAFGLHRLSGTFAPQGDGARLELYWEADAFPREPLGSQAVGHTGDLAGDDAFVRGQQAFERHRCGACHAGPAEVPLRILSGPSLKQAGARMNVDWIYQWLGSPDAMQAEASMPRLFADDPSGKQERAVLATYLARQGTPHPTEEVTPEAQQQRREAGQVLYRRVGCAACHDPQEDRPAPWSLSGLWKKTNEASLAEYLRDPLALHPDGAMPAMALSVEEAKNLACFLMQIPMSSPDAVESPPPVPREDLLELAKSLPSTDANASNLETLAENDLLNAAATRLLSARRCTACHEVGQEVQPLKVERNLAAICDRPEGGCLQPDHASASKVPSYGKAIPSDDLRAYLSERGQGSTHNAPGHAAELAMQRLNCTGCHRRNERGGLSTAMQAELAGGQAEMTAELIVPPTLTGISRKLTRGALDGVLKEGKRWRPWMSLRMPQFGAQDVDAMAHGLPAADAHFKEPQPDRTLQEELVEAGRDLIGAKGFGCTKCHDMLGVASGGTRGPDLALVTSRVERDWFERWLRDPQRIEPGTRMPTVFLDGQSPHGEILGGDPSKQREGMWQYLSVSDRRPPPEGMELPVVQRYPRGDRLIMARTFLPGLSPRGIAMRFGNGVHLAFDANNCRLGFAWTGEFLDMAPVWTDRGGRTAGLLGPVIWNAPPVFPWALSENEATSPPDIRGRAQDTEYGAAPSREPTPQTRQVHFEGYAIHEDVPTLRYKWERPEQAPVEFSERLESLRSSAGEGLAREATVASAEGTAWWWVGSSETKPVIQGRATDRLLENHVPATAGVWCQLQNEGKPLLVSARECSPKSEWVSVERDGAWELWLRLPGSSGEKRRAAVSVWRVDEASNETINQLETLEIERAARRNVAAEEVAKQVKP